MNLFEETKFVLKKYGISANKSLGQNFLINEDVINEIIEKSEISKEDLIIEIGPGIGTLTRKLLENARKVIAIELDTRMINILEERFRLYNNFDLINEDILKVDLNKIIDSNIKKDVKHVKVVANLPYYITTPIIMKLLEENLRIDSITVMVQKEVADRLIAIPGKKDAGAITYTVYYYAESRKIVNVSRDSFTPIPKVDSEVIQLRKRINPAVKVKDKELLFKIIKYAFMKRRKTFINAIEGSDIIKNKAEMIQILDKLGINEKVRGEDLTIEQFAQITNMIFK